METALRPVRKIQLILSHVCFPPMLMCKMLGRTEFKKLMRRQLLCMRRQLLTYCTVHAKAVHEYDRIHDEYA